VYLGGVAEGTRSPWRWTVVVPVLTLALFGVGFVTNRVSRVEERPLEVTPPPEAQLPGIVLPPRARELRGVVVGPDGAPVADALVSLIASDEPHWTYSNARGEFELLGLERGPWTVTVTATAHQPWSTTIDDAVGPTVLQLPDAPRAYPTFATRRLAPLAGTVGAARTRAKAGVEVLFTPTAPLQRLDAPYPRRVRCDEAGRFALADLEVGEYTVVVLPEWAQNGSWPDISRAEGTPPRVWTHAAGGDATLALDDVSGAVQGKVLDGEQNPLAGALVLVSSDARREDVWPPVTADARGEFTVADLPPGRYAVSVRAGSGSYQSSVLVRAGETTDLALPPLSVERPR
jgi:hypothetical protein